MSKFINIIICPVGNECNLRCKYCYTKSYGKGSGLLSIKSVYKLIQVLMNFDELENVVFTWHGGEPLLMGVKYFAQVLELEHQIIGDKLRYVNVIQSNGLLLNDEWYRLIKKENVSIGISIDGADYFSNRSRFRSREEFDLLFKNLINLKSAGIRPALFVTLTRENINSLEKTFKFIENYRPLSYTFNPIKSNNSYLTAEQWKSIILKMKQFSDRTHIPNVLTYHIDRGLNGQPPQMCLLNSMCNKFVSLDNKGNLYASCVAQTRQLLLDQISNSSFGENLNKYINTHTVGCSPSIYERLGYLPQYKYFQGNGCEKCRSFNDNESYISGVVKYMRSI